MNWEIKQGHAIPVLQQMEDESIHCVVTSPPYWGLRDYGLDPVSWGDWEGSLGSEPTPEMYVDHLVEVFREVKRVLREDGTVWLNMGDSYGHKNLIGMPWRLAFALQADGSSDFRASQVISDAISRLLEEYDDPTQVPDKVWGILHDLEIEYAEAREGSWWLRSDIIWSKPNPMPESVRDRPTRSHEYVFLLTKAARYYYDADAVKTPPKDPYDDRKGRAKESHKRMPTGEVAGVRPRGSLRPHQGFNQKWDSMTKEEQQKNGANLRDVWRIATRPFPDAHFAVFPESLVEPCVRAGSPAGGVVLDPFCGSGTTGLVAISEGRSFIGIELSSEYTEMAEERLNIREMEIIRGEMRP